MTLFLSSDFGLFVVWGVWSWFVLLGINWVESRSELWADQVEELDEHSLIYFKSENKSTSFTNTKLFWYTGGSLGSSSSFSLNSEIIEDS